MLGLTMPARRSFSLTWKLSVFACALVLASSAARAAIPADPAKRAAVVGMPAALQVQPAALTLIGPRAMQQIVVTARYADGEVGGVIQLCDFRVVWHDAAS